MILDMFSVCALVHFRDFIDGPKSVRQQILFLDTPRILRPLKHLRHRPNFEQVQLVRSEYQA